MTTITEVLTPVPGVFGHLVDKLWNGEVSETDFVKLSHDLGVSPGRIEWEIETLKTVDGVGA